MILNFNKVVTEVEDLNALLHDTDYFVMWTSMYAQPAS